MKFLLPFYLTCAALLGADRPAQPNVLLIFVDDLGWQDVMCYDIDEEAPYETPHLDALAERGVQFWQGYSPAPTCAPSRCALMSGIHPARAQKTHVVGGAPPQVGSPHQNIITPWYSGRIKEDGMALSQVLQKNGYATGHTGKWHIAQDHHSAPQPGALGFDYTSHNKGEDTRGVQSGMKNRLENFSTTEEDSPYRIDENGYPTDPVTENALKFMEQNKDKPFFMYNATWLVHAPLQTHSKALLEKYCTKMGVEYPTDPVGWKVKGQKNPYYGAMVETLDYYSGKLISYLEKTDDPRWEGHKLIDNTYIVFTSDNGGMEGSPKEIYTDNYPLEGGKLRVYEGGVRVPFLIAGPNIPSGVESDVVINALDLYPTIMSWTGITAPKALDGDDLSTLLTEDPTQPALVKNKAGAERKNMIWHYPHPSHSCSAIRHEGYKLYHNYDNVYTPTIPAFNLYKLYDKDGKRADIEEKKDLAEENPELVEKMYTILSAKLTEMDATKPYYNPLSAHIGEEKKNIPTVSAHEIKDGTVSAAYTTNGAQVVKAYLHYTLDAKARKVEWYRNPATITAEKVSAEIPKGATHFYLNLVDENNFLVTYPKIPTNKERGGKTIEDFAAQF